MCDIPQQVGDSAFVVELSKGQKQDVESSDETFEQENIWQSKDGINSTMNTTGNVET
jgi:hypothetical protein